MQPIHPSIQGNFRALVKYRVEEGDAVLEEHIKRTPKNATYLSKTIQNLLTSIIVKTISTQIVHNCKEASGLFSLSADEVRAVQARSSL